jgi:hypothetical protein
MIYYRETHVSSLIQCDGWCIIYRQFNKCSVYVPWSKTERLGDDKKKKKKGEKGNITFRQIIRKTIVRMRVGWKGVEICEYRWTDG